MNKKKAILIISIILVIASAYLFGLIFFSSHFLPNTSIDGIDVSMMSIDKANEALKDLKPQIRVIQKNSDGSGSYEQLLSLRDIDKDITYDAAGNISDQNTALWFVSLFNKKEYGPKKIKGTLDQQKLDSLIDDLYCLQDENIKLPINAQYKIENAEAVLLSADDGSYIDRQLAISAVREHINNLLEKADSLDLDLTGLYSSATVYDDDPSLEEKKTNLERLLNKTLDLDIYGEQIQLDKTVIASLLNVEESDPSINEDRLDDYLLKLAIDNDTSSSYIDKPDLKTKLKEALLSTNDEILEVKSLNGQPARRVDVKINEQTLYYYEDDVLTLKSPIVSGNKDITDKTPTGEFSVRKKVTNTSLMGRDYLEHVDYWIGFDETGRIYGLHDAQWRDEFGGDIWLYDPSRGCVNMPLDKIGLVYERLDLGDEINISE